MEKAPLFTLFDTDGNELSLKEFAGKWVVLYFYPKDNTPGCIIEATGFTKFLPEFTEINTVILGVSPDSQASHQRFREKKQLEVRLLSDPDHTVLKQYGVWRPKKMFGKEFLGVVRSTFIIDPAGLVRHIWDKVKVTNHVETVLETVKTLQNS
ncbi:thioredoxin-dependent thiol peroxidase [bacterium]|nr:thioredoxin-dependent thiol peroxidase [bacterium]